MFHNLLHISLVRCDSVGSQGTHCNICNMCMLCFRSCHVSPIARLLLDALFRDKWVDPYQGTNGLTPYLGANGLTLRCLADTLSTLSSPEQG